MKYIGKRCVAALLAVVMVFVLLPGTARAEDFPSSLKGGGQSAEDPYQIESADQLRQLSQYVNDGNDCSGKYFKLAQDIDLEKKDWVPIGKDNEHQFKGIFDGNNFTVSGLYIGVSKIVPVGLFGDIGEGGTVKNLGVSGSVTGEYYVGGIAGRNYGTIENCHNAADVDGKGTSVYAGGIAGYDDHGTVKDCYNVGEIQGDKAGGIMGLSSGTVTNCYNTGKIQGDDVGGIAGWNYTCTVTNCYNTGAVVGTGSYGDIGGIVGMLGSGGVKNCYNTGNISGEDDIGGIVGNNYGTATNCYYLEGKGRSRVPLPGLYPGRGLGGFCGRPPGAGVQSGGRDHKRRRPL